LTFLSNQISASRKHHGRRHDRFNVNPWEQFLEAMKNGIKDGEKFFRHQMRNSFRNREWNNARFESGSSERSRSHHHGRRRHGKRVSSGSDSEEKKPVSIRNNQTKDIPNAPSEDVPKVISRDEEGQKSTSQHKDTAEEFKSLIRNLQCENSPVYQKFYTYFKRTMERSQEKTLPQHQWLKEIADQIRDDSNKNTEICPAKPHCGESDSEIGHSGSGNNTSQAEGLTMQASKSTTTSAPQRGKINATTLEISTVPEKVEMTTMTVVTTSKTTDSQTVIVITPNPTA
jgi:hypothetical protein